MRSPRTRECATTAALAGPVANTCPSSSALGSQIPEAFQASFRRGADVLWSTVFPVSPLLLTLL